MVKTKLAIDGGPKAVTGPIPRFNSLGIEEEQAAKDCIIKAYAFPEAWPLSGFLGGELRGGHYVQHLEELWADKFKVKHAIACNSATSGLLLACMAAGVKQGTSVWVPAYTMSATAAAPAFLGADIHFCDIYEDIFCINRYPVRNIPVIIPVNLFGHPATLTMMREAADKAGCCMIEDNAQAIFATEGGKYAGTIGHIGVFSLNVHKLLQCGEGGICVTDDDELAHRMRLGLNHAELASVSLGLNLRMTEVTAAIALEQLLKGEKIVAERREVAEAIIDAAKPLLEPPAVRENCTHSYYVIPWLDTRVAVNREWVVAALRAEGVPVREGYTTPLYRLPAFMKDDKYTVLPITEEVEAMIITYENCWWAPTSKQLKQFKEAFEKVADAQNEKVSPDSLAASAIWNQSPQTG